MGQFHKYLKLLLLSTPVAPLGSGLEGGIELTIKNIAKEMIQRGHTLKVVAPQGSILENIPIIEIPEELQPTAQNQSRHAPVVIPANSVLANMWDYARKVQNEYDLIFNIAYDWLPFYLTPFFNRPIAHLVSMGSLTDAMDSIMEKVAVEFPDTIGVFTVAQAETFSFSKQCRYLSSGFDLSLYEFCAEPELSLAWVGRIAPEKGLEDAVAAAEITGIGLKIMGQIQDQDYWQKIRQNYPNAPIEYLGFMSTAQLQHQLRQCRAMLMTPRWVEAFGNVVIEALACGVPVIAYKRGGPSEIIKDGKTGFLVEPDSVQGLVEAIKRIDELDRSCCRQQAETEYSASAMGDRMEKWFFDILRDRA